MIRSGAHLKTEVIAMWTCHSCTAEMFDVLDVCRKCGTAKGNPGSIANTSPAGVITPDHWADVERFRRGEKAAQLRGLEGISGWLILPTIGLILIGFSLVLILSQLAISYGFSSYHRAGGWVLIMMLTHLALLSFLVYTTAAFFRKKANAPSLMMNLMLANIAASFLLFWMGYDSLKWAGLAAFAYGVFIAAICIPYLKTSERVKATFTGEAAAKEHGPRVAPRVSQEEPTVQIPRVDREMSLSELEDHARAMHEAGLTDVEVKERLISSGVKNATASTVMKNVGLTNAILLRVYYETFYDEFNRFADFTGRSSRYQFWVFMLVHIVVGFVLSSTAECFGSIYALLVILPSWAITVRRLHDTGRSGWWILLPLAPFIILIFGYTAPRLGNLLLYKYLWFYPVVFLLPLLILLLFALQAGDKEPNKYGPPPR